MTDISDLLEALYGTVQDAARWPEVLQRISDAVSATQTLLFVVDPAIGNVVLRCGQTPDDLLRSYLAHYGSVNSLAEPCDRMFRDGTARFSHIALPDAAFTRSEFYQDFFRKHDLFYSLGVKKHTDAGALHYLSVQRPWSLAPFVQAEGSILTMLMPHVQQALSLGQGWVSQAESRGAAESVLAAFGRLVIGIDAAGRIRYTNAAANELLRIGSSLYEHNKRLFAKDSLENERLQSKLASVLNMDQAFAKSCSEALFVQDTKGTSHLRVVILPHRSSSGRSDEIRAVLSIDAPYAAVPRGLTLSKLYGLSTTECRIADLLFTGKDLKEASETLNLTLETTRFYVKRILNKTGQRRQSDLIRVMGELPGQR